MREMYVSEDHFHYFKRSFPQRATFARGVSNCHSAKSYQQIAVVCSREREKGGDQCQKTRVKFLTGDF
jgi:hypothetical protein